MAEVVNRKVRSSSLLDTAFSRFTARIAPLIREQLVGALISELERHFNEQLLPELHEQVKRIVVSELQERVEGVKRSQVYSLNSIVGGTVSGEYMTTSNVLTRDFLHPEYQEFCRIYKEPFVEIHRKWWEWEFIYNRLSKAGVLRPGMRGLGFGVGFEKLPSFFASFGANITATDAPGGINWSDSSNASDYLDKLFSSELIDRESFDNLVYFEYCDMNDIPEHLTNYDFCWSSCAFEHLGSLQHGLDFVINSIERTLKVGGTSLSS